MFETKEEINKYFSGDKIQCLICCKWFMSLGCHVLKMHDITVDEYKDKFGLPYSRGLVSDAYRAVQSKRMLKRYAAGEKGIMQISKVAHLGQQTKNRLQPFARKLCSENLNYSMYNAEQTTTIQQMESFIVACETNKLKPWQIRKLKKAKEYGIICFETYHRNIKKYPMLKQRMSLHLTTLSDSRFKTDMTRCEIKKNVISLRQQGLTSREIGKQLSVDRKTVMRIIHDKGVWKNIT